MGQDKSHKNCIEYHKEMLESKHNFNCRKEFPVPVNGKIHQIDLGCFRSEENPQSIGIEAESLKSFNSQTPPNTPAIISNSNDLLMFKKLHGDDTRTWHINTNEVIDFQEELKEKSRDSEPEKIKNIEKIETSKRKLPLRISLSW